MSTSNNGMSLEEIKAKLNNPAYFSDDYPFLMLPVRLETRFMEIPITPLVVTLTPEEEDVLKKTKELEEKIRLIVGFTYATPHAPWWYVYDLVDEWQALMDAIDAVGTITPAVFQKIKLCNVDLFAQMTEFSNILDKETKYYDDNINDTNDRQKKLQKQIDEIKKKIKKLDTLPEPDIDPETGVVDSIKHDLSCNDNLSKLQSGLPFTSSKAMSAYRKANASSLNDVFTDIGNLSTPNYADRALLSSELHLVYIKEKNMRLAEQDFWKAKLDELVDGGATAQIPGGWAPHTHLQSLRNDLLAHNSQPYSALVNVLQLKEGLADKMSLVQENVDPCGGTKIAQSDKDAIDTLWTEVLSHWEAFETAEQVHFASVVDQIIISQESLSPEVSNIKSDIACNPVLKSAGADFPFGASLTVASYKVQLDLAFEDIHSQVDQVTAPNSADHGQMTTDLQAMVGDGVALWQGEWSHYETVLTALIAGSGTSKVSSGWQAHTDLVALRNQLLNLNAQTYSSLGSIIPVKSDLNSRMATVTQNLDPCAGAIIQSDFDQMETLFLEVISEQQKLLNSERSHFLDAMAARITPSASETDPIHTSIINNANLYTDQAGFGYSNPASIMGYRSLIVTDLYQVHLDLEAVTVLSNTEYNQMDGDLSQVLAVSSGFRGYEWNYYDSQIQAVLSPTGGSQIPGWQAYSELTALKNAINSANAQSYASIGNVITLKSIWANQLNSIENQLSSIAGTISFSDYSQFSSDWAQMMTEWGAFELKEKNHFLTNLAAKIGSPPSASISPVVDAIHQEIVAHPYFIDTFNSFPFFSSKATESYRQQVDIDLQTVHQGLLGHSGPNLKDLDQMIPELDAIQAAQHDFRANEWSDFNSRLTAMVSGSASSITPGWQPYKDLLSIKGEINGLIAQPYANWGNVVAAKNSLGSQMETVASTISGYQGEITSNDRSKMQSRWNALLTAWDSMEQIEHDYHLDDLLQQINGYQVGQVVGSEAESIQDFVDGPSELKVEHSTMPFGVAETTKAYRGQNDTDLFNAEQLLEAIPSLSSGDRHLINLAYLQTRTVAEEFCDQELNFFTAALNAGVNEVGASQVAAGWNVYTQLSTAHNLLQTSNGQNLTSPTEFLNAKTAGLQELFKAQNDLNDYEGDLLQTDADQTTQLLGNVQTEWKLLLDKERNYVVDTLNAKLVPVAGDAEMGTAVAAILSTISGNQDLRYLPENFDYSDPIAISSHRGARHILLDQVLSSTGALSSVNSFEYNQLFQELRRIQTIGYDFQRLEWDHYLNLLDTQVSTQETSLLNVGGTFYNDLLTLKTDLINKNALNYASLNDVPTFKTTITLDALNIQEKIKLFASSLGENEMSLVYLLVQDVQQEWQAFEATETAHFLGDLLGKTTTVEQTLPLDNLAADITNPLDSASSTLASRAANPNSALDIHTDKIATATAVNDAVNKLLDYESINETGFLAAETKLSELLQNATILNRKEWRYTMDLLQGKAQATPVDLINGHGIDHKPVVASMVEELELIAESEFEPLDSAGILKESLANKTKSLMEMMELAPAIDFADLHHLAQQQLKISQLYQDFLYRENTLYAVRLQRLADAPQDAAQPDYVAPTQSYMSVLETQMTSYSSQQLSLDNTTDLMDGLLLGAHSVNDAVENIAAITSPDRASINSVFNQIESGFGVFDSSVTVVLNDSYNEQSQFITERDQYFTRESDLILSEQDLEERDWQEGDIGVDTPEDLIGTVEPMPTVQNELWIRVYPDDIAVDTHETDLAQDEFDDTQVFWTSMFSETLEMERKIAWKRLLDAHGTFRSAYLAEVLKPLNYTVPGAGGTPTFPALTEPIKQRKWSRASKSFVMPDQFVFMVYRGDKVSQHVGNLVNEGVLDLILGLDPAKVDELNPDVSPEHYFEYDAEGNFQAIDPDMEWLTDFPTAVAKGMAYRLPISATDAQNGFDKVVVMGLRSTGTDTPNVRALQISGLVENLLENHHYGNDGISFLDQGTPTNNTSEVDAGFGSTEPDWEESYDAYHKDPLFEMETDIKLKADGQWFTEALGLKEEIIERIPNAGSSTIRDGVLMNRALWPATMGYFIESFLGDVLLGGDLRQLDTIRDFFCDFTSGRGKIPTIRVGDQPYGMLPVSLFDKLEWENEAIPGRYKVLFKKYQKMIKTLEEQVWNSMRDKVEYLHREVQGSTDEEKIEDNQVKLANLMGLHASSVEFYVRYCVTNGEVRGGSFIGHLLQDYEGSFFNRDTQGNHQNPFFDLFAKLAAGEPFSMMSNIVQNIVIKDHELLKAQTIDPVKSSDDIELFSELRKLSDKFDDKNYIKWLAEASEEDIQKQPVNIKGEDNSLLYMLLRKAILVEFEHTAERILDKAIPLDDNVKIDIQEIRKLADVPEEDKYDLVKVIYDPGDEEPIALDQYVRLTEATNLDNNHTFLVLETNDEGGGLHSITIQNENAVDTTLNGKIAVTADVGYGTAIRREMNFVSSRDYSEFKVKANKTVLSPKTILKTDVTGIEGQAQAITLAEYISDFFDDGNYVEEKEYIDRVRNAFEGLKNQTTAVLERAFAEHLDICSYRLDAWKLALANYRLEKRREKPGKDKGLYLGAYGWVENLRPSPPQEAPVEKIPEGYTGDTLHLHPENQGYIHAPSIEHATTAAILKSGYIANARQGTDESANAMAINLSSARIRTATYILEGVRNGQSLGAMLGYLFERNLRKNLNLRKYLYEFREAFPANDTQDTETGAPEESQSDSTISAVRQAMVVNGNALLQKDRLEDFPWGITEIQGIPQGDKDALEALVKELHDALDALNDLNLAEGVHAAATGNQARARGLLGGGVESRLPGDIEVIKTPRSGKRLHNKVALVLEYNATNPGTTPRSMAEPRVNHYLAQVMGDLSLWGLKVLYDTQSSTNNIYYLTVDQLGLSPVDLLYMLNEDPETVASNLDEWVMHYVRTQLYLQDPNFEVSAVRLRYFDDPQGLKPLGDMIPLFTDLRNMLMASRPLHAADFELPEQPFVEEDAQTDLTGFDETDFSQRVNNALTSQGLDNLLLQLQAVSYVEGTAQQGPNTNIEGQAALQQASLCGFPGSLGLNIWGESTEELQQLGKEAARLTELVQARIDEVNKAVSAIANENTVRAKVEKWTEVGKTIFSDGFLMVPMFQLSSIADPATGFSPLDHVNNAWVQSDLMISNNIGGSSPTAAFDPMGDWLQGVSLVRPRTAQAERLLLFNELLDSGAGTLIKPIQIPFEPNDYWLGMEYPADSPELDARNSLVVLNQSNSFPAAQQCGLLIDEWTEVIPSKEITTGIAFNYDQPDARAPQTCLLMVGPRKDGKWYWDDMVEILEQTFQLAKDRAIEPDHFTGTGLDQLLPAILSPVTKDAYKPSIQFGHINQTEVFKNSHVSSSNQS